MSKNLNMSVLMDFYGQLLTDKQRLSLEYYYNDDLSLGEIADELSISRQGVRDFIKRGEKQLTELEEKLGLALKFSEIKDKINEIDEISDELSKACEGKAEIDKLKTITSEIMEML